MHRREELSDLELLREVASLTGGKLTLGNEPQQIALAVASIEKDLRAQYLIGFTPTGHGAVKYREISLKLAGRIRSVRVRAGYLGTEPPLLPSHGQDCGVERGLPLIAQPRLVSPAAAARLRLLSGASIMPGGQAQRPPESRRAI